MLQHLSIARYEALVDSGMGSRVIGGGLDDGMLQAHVSTTLAHKKSRHGEQ